MKIKIIELGADQPVRITAEMTMDEAAYLARITGKQNDLTSAEIMAGGSGANSEIYGCLTGDLFNRFYDDGVDGYLRGGTS